MKTVEDFQKQLMKDSFGILAQKEQNTGNCIQCKEPAIPNCYSEAGKKEFKISGLCEKCFDKLWGEE